MNNPMEGELIQQIDQIMIIMMKIKDICNLIDIQNCEEHIVEHGLKELWFDCEYVIDEVLYHMNNYMKGLANLKLQAERYGVGTYFMIPDATISFELDALLVSFWRFNDNQLCGEIKRYSAENVRESIDSLFLRKSDVLYWRFLILRNRAAHCPMAPYKTINGEAKRFITIMSKCNLCHVTDTGLSIITTLIDVSKIHGIEYAISELVNNKEGHVEEVDLFDFLLKSGSLQKSPKGVGKKSPQLLYPNEDVLFDSYKDFYGLAIDMVKHMNRIATFFHDSLKKTVVYEE